MSDKWYVYILECLNKSLYTGITKNLKQRLKAHRQGKGGHFTQGFGAKKILYFEEYADRSAASKREYEIKSWKRHKKLELIKTEKEDHDVSKRKSAGTLFVLRS